MQNDEVIDWGEDMDDNGDVISLGGSDTEGVPPAAAPSGGYTSKPSQSRDNTTNTEHNMVAFDGPRLEIGWILRISSVGEPYFYHTVDKKSVWRCPGYTQPAVSTSTSKGGTSEAASAGEGGKKRRRVSSQPTAPATPAPATTQTPSHTQSQPSQRDRSSSGREERDERDRRQLERVEQIERMERVETEKEHNYHHNQPTHNQRQAPRQPRSNYPGNFSNPGRGSRGNGRPTNNVRLPERPAMTYSRADRNYRYK